MNAADATFRQRILACSGFYKAAIDGDWGPKSQTASAEFQAEYLRLQREMGKFDDRTEGVIVTLLPKAQAKAREFMRIAGGACKLISGTRTYPEQDALYAQGRTKPGNVVTNARAGQSNHNFGIAWDVGIWKNGKYLTGATPLEDHAYISLAKNIKANVKGLEWGGDWKSPVDMPHYQLASGQSTLLIRPLFEAGKPFI